MPQCYLICEGVANGLDNRILDATVAQILGVPVVIEPAGGTRNLRSHRTWRGQHSTVRAVSVEDRDYRSREAAENTWRGSGNNLIWRRHEIENYLLIPELVLAAFESFRRTVGQSWTDSLPATKQEVEQLLARLVAPMLEYHAGRVLQQELRDLKVESPFKTEINIPDSSQLKTPPPLTPRSEWLDALQQEVLLFKRGCKELSALDEFEESHITERYDRILGSSRDQAFIDKQVYLLDVAGKDLLAALIAELTNRGAATGLNRKTLENELVRALRNGYRPDLYQPDDFKELADRLA